METLVATHHRNHHQYYGRNRGYDSTKFDSFGSAPSDNFRGISCRTFQSGAGLLPAPLRSYSHSFTKNSLSAPLSPETPSTTFSENKKDRKPNAKSSLVAIPIKFKLKMWGKFISLSAGLGLLIRFPLHRVHCLYRSSQCTPKEPFPLTCLHWHQKSICAQLPNLHLLRPPGAVAHHLLIFLIPFHLAIFLNTLRPEIHLTPLLLAIC